MLCLVCSTELQVSLSRWQGQKSRVSFLTALSTARIHKRFRPVSFPTTHNPFTQNSLFLEGAAPWPATVVRMQHGTAVHGKGARVRLPGFEHQPCLMSAEPHNGKLLHREVARWQGGSVCKALRSAPHVTGTRQMGERLQCYDCSRYGVEVFSHSEKEFTYCHKTSASNTPV